MRPLFKFFTAALFSVSALTGCGSGDSPFTEGGGSGGSSTNIISSSNFGIGASVEEPNVLEFAIGSVNPPGSTTANISDLQSVNGAIVSEITVTAADNSGALVNEGTVYFSTQYGTLSDSQCRIQKGVCSVTWKSILDLNALAAIYPSGVIDIMNVVTAWTYGAEGFIDVDGNKILSSSPQSATPAQTYSEIFIDTEEPFLDRNDNGIYDLGIDSTIIDPIHNGRNGFYDGSTCDTSTRSDCLNLSSIPIFASVYLRLNYDSSDVTGFNVVIDTPSDGDNILLGTSINFTATAMDPEDGEIIGNDDPLTGNNIQWASDVDGLIPGNTNNINFAGLSLGDHTILVTATDSNLNQVSSSINISITGAPTVAINTPASGDTFTTGVSINFTATATDPEDGTIVDTNNPVPGVNISWSSNLDGSLGTSNNINASLATAGAHIITVTVTDSDGNTSTSTINLTII